MTDTIKMSRVTRLTLIAGCLGLLLFISSCGKETAPPVPTPPPGPVPRGSKPYVVLGKTYYPMVEEAKGFSETGLASWYGPGFAGKKTSSGEIYDVEGMTAAHKILPLNTWVEVTNQVNGKKAVVRVNDRGPFVDGRIIDLSKAAARELGVLGPGTAPVEVVALGYRREGTGEGGRPPVYDKPADFRAGPFTVQIGAFQNESNAWRLAAIMRADHRDVTVTPYDRGDMVLNRVRVGKLTSLDQAMELQARLRRAGQTGAFVVAW